VTDYVLKKNNKTNQTAKTVIFCKWEQARKSFHWHLVVHCGGRVAAADGTASLPKWVSPRKQRLCSDWEVTTSKLGLGRGIFGHSLTLPWQLWLWSSFGDEHDALWVYFWPHVQNFGVISRQTWSLLLLDFVALC